MSALPSGQCLSFSLHSPKVATVQRVHGYFPDSSAWRGGINFMLHTLSGALYSPELLRSKKACLDSDANLKRREVPPPTTLAYFASFGGPKRA
jgi:hypothetical protein